MRRVVPPSHPQRGAGSGGLFPPVTAYTRRGRASIIHCVALEQRSDAIAFGIILHETAENGSFSLPETRPLPHQGALGVDEIRWRDHLGRFGNPSWMGVTDIKQISHPSHR